MKRATLLLLSLAAIIGFALPAAAQTPAPKPACHSFLPVVGCNGIVNGVLNTVGGIASSVTPNPVGIVSGAIHAGQAVAGGWAKGPVGFVANNMGDAIFRCAGAIVHELDGATIPANFPSWFLDSWGVTRNLGFEILFLCYVIAIIAGVLKANLARIAQTPALAAAVVGGMFLTLVVVSVVVQTVDWLCLQIMGPATANIGITIQSFGAMLSVSSLTGPGSNVLIGFGVIFLSLVAFAFVFFNLLVRKWIIYIATGMFALALSGSLTKAGAKWLKFLTVLLGAMIASKPLLVVILSYGVSALAQPSSVSDVAGGGTVFLLCGLSPYLLVGIIVGGSMHALHGGAHAAGEPARMGRNAANSARRTHNHWSSFRSHASQRSTQQAAATQKAIAAQGKAAANSVFAARVSAAASVAAKTAKAATKAVKRAPAKASATGGGTQAPTGFSSTKSGLLVPQASHSRVSSAPKEGWTGTRHTCGGPNFGRLTAGCPRCDELSAGATPRDWIRPR